MNKLPPVFNIYEGILIEPTFLWLLAGPEASGGVSWVGKRSLPTSGMPLNEAEIWLLSPPKAAQLSNCVLARNIRAH